MIEILISDKLNTITENVYASRLPEKHQSPAIVYSVQSFHKHRELETSKHYTSTIQLNIYSDSYRDGKLMQQQLMMMFDDLAETVTLNNQKYSIDVEISNIVDLFNINVNQIVLDLQIEYIITNII